MIKVYIASPYTIGDQARNVRRQMDVFEELANIEGVAPFAPLLYHFQHMVHPRTELQWLELDREWVKTCDALIRLPGESKGADMEVQWAKTFDVPVFYSIEDFKHSFKL